VAGIQACLAEPRADLLGKLARSTGVHFASRTTQTSCRQLCRRRVLATGYCWRA
jgi:hypothetical protein